MRTSLHPLPFGDPCIHSMAAAYLFLDDVEVGGGEAMARPRRDSRVIVGQSGSGKTLSMLSHPLATLADGLGVVDIGNHLETHGINDVQRNASRGTGGVVEHWEKLWDVAVLKSVASHLLYSRDMDCDLEEEERSVLESFMGSYDSVAVPIEVTTALGHLCGRKMLRNEFKERYGSELLSEARRTIEAVLTRRDDFVCLVDVNDELVDNSPMAWSECLQGLLFYVLSNSNNGPGKPVVVITASERVYHAAVTSARGAKIPMRSELHRIRWRESDVALFLNRKIAGLDERFILRPDWMSDRPVAAWLGAKSIKNRSSNALEPIHRYLMRHMRCSPRHVITLGNALCGVVSVAKAKPSTKVPASEISKVVHSIASDFARELIMACSCDLVVAGLPSAVESTRCARYLGVNEDVDLVSAMLVDLIKTTLRDFPSEGLELSDLKRCVAQHFGVSESDAHEVLAIMLRHQVFGRLSEGRGSRQQVLFLEAFEESIALLFDGARFVLHSMIRDHVQGNGGGFRF